MITLIEIIFGLLITIALSIILILFWFFVAKIPWYLAKELLKIVKNRIPLIILGIVFTAIYYIYFPWGIFSAPYGSQVYHGEDISIAATGFMDRDHLNKSEMGFLYYQPKIVINSDRLFAYYRIVKATEPDPSSVQVIGVILDIPKFIIFVIVYKLIGGIIAALFVVWAPSISFTIGCFKR